MKLTIGNNNRIKLDTNRLNLYQKVWPGTTAFVWYDASDAQSVITMSGSSNVNWLLDKGKHGRHMVQAEAAHQPIFNSVQQNGNSTITFINTNYLSNTGDYVDLQDSIFLIACKPNGVGKQYKAVLSYNGDGSDFQIDAGDGAAWWGRFNSSSYTNNQFDTIDSEGIPQILGFTSDKTSGTLTGYKNGNQKFVINNFTGFDSKDVRMALGVNRNLSRYQNMDFYEMIISPIDEKDKITDYLMNKWNIS